ncbi:DUF5050 domain-containing protein [Amphibacillus sediminis]|uniref:DUF5050 domain-containing protein n=1 Tax=Amphibacillus sediminis TaxID=360185 RepID=UPI00082D6566|nr:DUF5050 domain-containing protein [Amphibacillus sediminis]
MFFYQKGWLWVSLYFIFSFAFLFFFDSPKNPELEKNNSSYQYYLDLVNGSHTDETEQLFRNEANRISEAQVELTKIYDDYYDGHISEKELQDSIPALEKIIENERGFQVIFDQYKYVRENPDNRYYLATNGWDGLLSTEQLDFGLLLLLLLLVTPVFCAEFSSDMRSLHLTLRKGTREHAISKMLLVFFVVIIISILSIMLRYGFYDIKYGLDHGNYPLQSLSYFGASLKEISLSSTFLWSTILKIFGNLIFAMLIMLFSVLTKKYALTLFSSTIIILLPYYLFTLDSSKYFLPGPLGFMLSTGYFRGSEYERNPFTDQIDLIYEGVPVMTLVILLIISLCIGIGAWIVILYYHTNAWYARKRRHKLKSLSITLLLCMIAVTLVGCDFSNKVDNEHDIFNSISRQTFENDSYRFYIDESDVENIRPVFEDKETGEINNLMRSPFSSLTSIENYIYGNGSLVYYLKMDYDKSGFYKETNRLSLIEVDTTTFDEKIIYEKNANMTKDTFLGLHTTDDIDFLGITSFFVDKKHIYFVVDDNQIRRINRLTGKTDTIIQTSVFNNIAYNGRYIYYPNEAYQIIKYDIQTEKEMTIPDIITTQFFLTDSELLYINRQDNYSIYAMNLSDSNIRKITNKPAWSITSDDDYIYYNSKIDNELYRIDRDGQNEMLLNEDNE